MAGKEGEIFFTLLQDPMLTNNQKQATGMGIGSCDGSGQGKEVEKR